MIDKNDDPIGDVDDPRLDGWYHTIELGDGLVTRGIFDHRGVVHATGIPDDLAGRTALDVGTANGYYAFEMEARGAERVVAVDVASSVDWDWLPQFKRPVTPDPMDDHRARFELARRMRGSAVEYHTSSVYDLSPNNVGVFDVVVCGSLLLHLQSPLRALAAIRSVTRELAVVEVWLDTELERLAPALPLLSFGARAAEEEAGEACTYWRFTTAALMEMMEYAGFTDCEPMPPYLLPHQDLHMRTIRARPRPASQRSGWHMTPAQNAERIAAHRAAAPSPPVPRVAAAGALAEDPVLAPLLAVSRDDAVLSAGLLTGVGGARELEQQRRALSDLRDYADHLLTEIERRDRHTDGVTAYVRHLEQELAAKEGYIAGLEQRVRAAEGTTS
ncbi:MAG TPA: methyltransferase domain-containing protein [Candidatus Angelobacter sp.]|jgi:tRNA (mo5U34)-methyltransferase|nr:methyltransferase domain-containing protein [Candidatus Angelobacter sp.]